VDLVAAAGVRTWESTTSAACAAKAAPRAGVQAPAAAAAAPGLPPPPADLLHPTRARGSHRSGGQCSGRAHACMLRASLPRVHMHTFKPAEVLQGR
jgi:hypothetical protein